MDWIWAGVAVVAAIVAITFAVLVELNMRRAGIPTLLQAIGALFRKKEKS